jgi:hypothetical protein
MEPRDLPTIHLEIVARLETRPCEEALTNEPIVYSVAPESFPWASDPQGGYALYSGANLIAQTWSDGRWSIWLNDGQATAHGRASDPKAAAIEALQEHGFNLEALK